MSRRRTSSATRLMWLRRIPATVPGKARVARWLVTSDAGDPTVVVDRDGWTFDVPNLREPIAFHLAASGAYEPETRALVLRSLHEGGVFADVGANIGSLAIPAAGRVGASGRVLAIEPAPDVFPYLEQNVRRNVPGRVFTYPVAATASDGPVDFFPAPADHFGMGSRGAEFGRRPVVVPGRTLDALLEAAGIDHVDVLKVDVEGFEVDVFEGASHLLRGPAPPLVLFEFCDWAEARLGPQRVGDGQRLLLDWGFSLWRLPDFERSGLPLRKPVVTGTEMIVGRRLDVS